MLGERYGEPKRGHAIIIIHPYMVIRSVDDMGRVSFLVTGYLLRLTAIRRGNM